MSKVFLSAIFLSLCVLTSAKADNCGEWKPEWENCQRDSDCEATIDACGWWSSKSVNKKFSKVAKDLSVCQGAVLDCATPDAKKNPIPPVTCVANRCVVKK